MTLAGCCGALLCAVGGASYGATALTALTVCTDASPDGFDIVQYESNAAHDAAGQTIYDQWFRFKPGTTDVMPALVQSWRMSDDGRVYTLVLRPGVSFHTTPWFKPTREFNADDLLWSVNRVNDRRHWAHGASKNGYGYWEGMGMSRLIRSIEKVDAMTVRVTLTRPESPFIANMAMPALASVYSEEYAQQLRRSGHIDRLDTQPVGTGPFVFRSYRKDAVIRYDRHAAYWAGPPKIDQLIFAITPEASARVQRVKAGECLVGTSMKADSAAQLGDGTDIALVTNQPMSTAYVAPNAQKLPMSDRRFRQALALAVDRRTLIRSLYAGKAQPAVSLLPSNMWSHDASLSDRRDLERARQLVKDSGYDGRELTLFGVSGGPVDSRRAGELLQADWAAVGIRVRVQMMDLGELLKRTGQGDHDLVFLIWFSDNGDPDNFLTPNLGCAAVAGGTNRSRWCDPRFDELLESGRRSSDRRERSALYLRAQRLVYDEAAVIALLYPEQLTAVSRRVSGFVPSPLASHDFREVRLH